MLNKHNKASLDKILSWLAYFTCCYGEKPFKTFKISAFIVICAFLYMSFGVQINGQNKYCVLLLRNSTFIDSVRTIGDYIHFSIVTFTTVGFGNIVPIGISLIVSSIEMVLGVIMMSLFTGSLFRKLTR